METIDTILTYWFGADPDGAALAEERADLWWSKHAEVDKEIRERFKSSLQRANDGKLDHWLAEPRGRLALIILTDQFTRNVYRDSPQGVRLGRESTGVESRGYRTGS